MITRSILARLCLTALLLMAAAAGVLRTAARAADDDKDKKADDKEIARLIDLLGDCDEDKRADAEKKLIEMGEAAHEAVTKAAKDHPDADVRLRATLLVKKIANYAFRELKKMTGHSKPIRSVVVFKDGKRAVTCGEDASIRIWDLGTGKETKELKGHTKFVWQIGLSADEKELISSGGPEKTLRLWDLEKGDEIRQYKGFGKRAYAAALSPDGKYVVGGEGGVKDEDKDEDTFDVLVFDKESAKQVHRMKGHTGYVWRAAFSPDSKKLATAGINDNSYRVWDVAGGKSLHEGKDAHDNWVTDVAYSGDGKLLFTSGRDGKVKVWDAENNKLIKTLEGLTDDACEAIAVSKDGKRVLAADGNAVAVFDVDANKILHRFEGHTSPVTAVALLPDGRKALSADKDGTLRMWGTPK